jgi:hypothetical protein
MSGQIRSRFRSIGPKPGQINVTRFFAKFVARVVFAFGSWYNIWILAYLDPGNFGDFGFWTSILATLDFGDFGFLG